MKRFLAFAGMQYYPEGGMEDMVSSHDTIEQAVLAISQKDMTYTLDEMGVCQDIFNWAYVYDQTEEKIVVGLKNDDVGKIRSDVSYLEQYGVEGFIRGLKREPSEYLKERVRHKKEQARMLANSQLNSFIFNKPKKRLFSRDDDH